MSVPSDDAVHDIIEGAQEPLATLVAFLVATGARRSELLALRWCDVDIDGAPGTGRVVIEDAVDAKGNRQGRTKTAGSRRTISLGDNMAARLRGLRPPHAGPEDDIFGFRPDWFTKHFRKTADEFGHVDVKLSDLRHFAIARMLDGGLPLREVSGRVGHASTQLLIRRYGRWMPGDEQAAAAALDRFV